MRIIALLLFTGLLAACGSPARVDLYRLDAVAPMDESTLKSTVEVVVGVGPVEIPRYLDRNQILLRTGANRLDTVALDEWAEPLASNVAAVVAENLSRLLPAARAIARPWVDAPVTWEVPVKISRFDADSDGLLVLAADWGVVVASGRKHRVLRHTRIALDLPGTDSASVAAGMSTALLRLSEEIARELQGLD